MKSSSSTLFAIGDLHGCYENFLALLNYINDIAPKYRLIIVGDLVNKGPKSLAVLRLIRSLGKHVQVILGNHDLHLLAAAHGIRELNSGDTLEEILDAPDRTELLDWLRKQPLAIIEQNYLFLHAGVLPQWSATKTLSLAQEVENVLAGPNWIEFLHSMYGDKPTRWDDNLQDNDRLRCIVNALTRLRFCTKDGTMKLAVKEKNTVSAAEYLPWFDISKRKTQNITIVYGHWSTMGLVIRPNSIGLDTGCVRGGRLSAIRLSDRLLLQVSCPHTK